MSYPTTRPRAFRCIITRARPTLTSHSDPAIIRTSHPSLYHQSAGGFSTTTTSLATDSIATPVSGEDERVTSPAEAQRVSAQSSMIGALAKHVRTWVGSYVTSRHRHQAITSGPSRCWCRSYPLFYSLARAGRRPSICQMKTFSPTKDVTTPGDDFLLAGWDAPSSRPSNFTNPHLATTLPSAHGSQGRPSRRVLLVTLGPFFTTIDVFFFLDTHHS
jgi:hypothetical protein